MKSNYFIKSLGVWGIWLGIIIAICATFLGIDFIHIWIFEGIQDVGSLTSTLAFINWLFYGGITMVEILVGGLIIGGFYETMQDYKKIEKRVKTSIPVPEYTFTENKELIKKYKKEEK